MSDYNIFTDLANDDGPLYGPNRKEEYRRRRYRSTGSLVVSLSNDAASVVDYDITVTAVSSSDLSDPKRFGVEFGPGPSGPYIWSVSQPGALENQMITIGVLDGIEPGYWSIRTYYNLDSADPIGSRVYGATLPPAFVNETDGFLIGQG